MLECTCIDYLHGYICKHVHKVNIMKRCAEGYSQPTPIPDNNSQFASHGNEKYRSNSNGNAVSKCLLIFNCHSKNLGVQQRKERILFYTEKISSDMKDMSDTNTLDVVLAHLISASSCLQVSTELNNCPEPHSFGVKHQFTPAQKNETQLRFSKNTTKTKSKKRKLEYVSLYIIIISDDLYNNAGGLNIMGEVW